MSKGFAVSGDSPAPKKSLHANPTCVASETDNVVVFENPLETLSILFDHEDTHEASQITVSDDPSLDYIQALPSVFDGLELDEFTSTPEPFEDVVERAITNTGVESVAEAILSNAHLKQEIINRIFKEPHSTLKKSLKSTKLCGPRKDRNFLLTATPRVLCEELKSIREGFKIRTKNCGICH